MLTNALFRRLFGGGGHTRPESPTVIHEFECEACGRHIVRVSERPHEPPVCADCLHMPGWIFDPDLIRLLDPEYNRGDES
jgi:hypothetical protein